MKSIIIILILAMVLAVKADYEPQTQFSFFPPYWNSSYPYGSMNGMVVVVTGDSRGQGYSHCKLFQSLNATVYGISRTSPSGIPDLTWTHITGDITKKLDVAELILKLALDRVKVNYIVLNAGEHGYVFDQDQDPDTLNTPTQVNLYGNYRVYDMIRRANLLAPAGVRVGWTSSVGAVTFFGPNEAYDHAKAGIIDWIKRMALKAYFYGDDIYHFAIMPFGVDTNITCHPYDVCISDPVCQSKANLLYPVCPLPPPNPADGQTQPIDISRFYAYVLTVENPNATFYLVEANVGLDSNNNTYQSAWVPYWLNLSPKEFYAKWIDSIFPYFFTIDGAPAQCTTPPGIAIDHLNTGTYYCTS